MEGRTRIPRAAAKARPAGLPAALLAAAALVAPLFAAAQQENTAPVFNSGLAATISVNENTALNTEIGSPYTASDADDDALTYSLEGTDSGNFKISSTGQILTGAHLDYEARTSHSVTVKVSDDTDSATLDVTINITNLSDTGGDSSLTPSSSDAGVTRKSRATYNIRIQGNWTTSVSPGGLPGGAHFTTFVGGIHNDEVTFLSPGAQASSGVEFMAELGGTSTLVSEVNAQRPNADRSITLGNPGINSSRTHNNVTFTSDHPRITLTSMIAPSPDWFVGVSGRSLMDSSGNWLSSVTVNLYPWDAGTENGTEFSLSNPSTNPKGVIASLRGKGKFSGAHIARLEFTRTGSIELAPAAPAGFGATPSDGEVTLDWDVPTETGITGHEYRRKTGGAYGAWTAIADSAPSGGNEDSFTVEGLVNDTEYTFQLRAMNSIGGGAASAEMTATPKQVTLPELTLNLGVIAGDNRVNIAEKAAGFSIGGDTGSEGGVSVTVSVGGTDLTATSSAANPAIWSVSVPANAAYITGTSVLVRVTASKTGFTAPSAEERTLGVDLVAPTAPAYTAPVTLKVGSPITAMSPSGRSGIAAFSATGLPSGLAINPSTGVISGTPAAANAGTAAATVSVSDTAGNTAAESITFPAVARGDQVLSGFSYSSATVNLADTALTVTAPSGAHGALSYSASPVAVCNVDASAGALTLRGAGECLITVTAAATDDYNPATATFTVTVTVAAAGSLVLNLDTIAGDDTINMAERAAGFTISGNTGTEADVGVTVAIGAETLTATSAEDNGIATWSVSVPANAAYITGTSVLVSVMASKTGLTAPDDVVRTLTIDLTELAAPAYTAPVSLKVGSPITAMSPSGSSGVAAFSATGLPSGLAIDAATGVISGTPAAANAGTAIATVTGSDTAGNTALVSITFPAVARGDQTLVGFQYRSASVVFGNPAPSVTAPVGARTPLSYSAAPASVCTVNASTGALTIVGLGTCTVTVTAEGTDNYNAAARSYTLSVRASSSRVALTATPPVVGEGDGVQAIRVTARLDGAPRTFDTEVRIAVGGADDSATAGADYVAVADILLTIPAGKRSGTARFTLNPTDNAVDEADRSLTLTGRVDTDRLTLSSPSLTITDDDQRGVAVSVTALTVPEGRSSTYTVALSSEPTGEVTVTPSLPDGTRATVSGAMTFTADNWNISQVVTVSAPADADAEDDEVTVTHTVTGADYEAIEAGPVTVTLADNDIASTAVLLSVNTASLAEDAAPARVTVSAQLNRAPRTEDTQVTVSLGAAGDSAEAGADYAPVQDFNLTIAAGRTSATASFTLQPNDDILREPDEMVSVLGEAGAMDLDVIGTFITLTDDDASNNAPVFPAELPGSLAVAENTAAGTDLGAPFAATDVDGHALAYALEGVDATRFAVNAQSGQLTTRAALNHESRARYSVTVMADDGHGGRSGIAVNVMVTDVEEQPGTPAAPMVLASADSTTRLDVRWVAPDPNGGPAITGYSVEYRTGTTGDWTRHRHTGTRTQARIDGLTAASAYQVRVRARNGETPGDWSAPGAGSTGRASNRAPVLNAGLATELTVDENTAAGADLGAPFTATDADGDDLTYLLGAAASGAFTIDPDSGQLQTHAALDHETQASYTLSVTVSDGAGGIDSMALTVRVEDVDEQAGAAPSPMVLAATGSTTRLLASWRRPEANGGPPVSGYDVQYREATLDATDGVADPLVWIDHPHRGADTEAIIPYLDAGTRYDVRVRARNGEIAGAWSAPGAGRTGQPVNTPPVFDTSLPPEVTVAENTAADVPIGAPLTAIDADGDTLTYRLDGAHRGAFAIDAASGQLQTRAALDHESRATWPLIVRAHDGNGGADATRVNVRVTDLSEKAPALPAPGVLATADSTTSLDVRWAAPDANGGPAVIGYRVQYREGADGAWLDHAHQGAGTQATIGDLAVSTGYQVRVRALNGETPGDWSGPGAGSTGRTNNAAPVFDSGLPGTLRVNENTAAGTDLGAPFAATDADGDRLAYRLDGADRHAFTIAPDRGQLQTRAALDHEAKSSHTLTVTVSDGAGGAVAMDVTVIVADVAERPAPAAPPWVLSDVETATGLEVRWTAPDANGGPALTGYNVQYRAGLDNSWITRAHEGTSTRARITGLRSATGYQARVRALNGETPGEWSAPGEGNTARADNNAPAFGDDTATRSVPEDSEAGDPIGALVTAADPDGDPLAYFLDDAGAKVFDIDRQSGQIRVKAALDFEAGPTHAVTVTANDGNGGHDTVAVTIELIDRQEEQAILGPAAPTHVTLTRTEQAALTLRWAPSATDEIAGFEFRLGRYPEPGNGLAPPAFHCAGNRPFDPNGWRRIPDSGPGGANARAYRFDAHALGCRTLLDTFELRAQVRAVSQAADGTSTASAPSTEARVKDEAPRVLGIRLNASDLQQTEVGDALVFEVTFSEPVRVTVAGGTPTLAFELGENTRQASFLAASGPPLYRNYGSGPIGRILQFRYAVQDGDDLINGIAVPADAITLAGAAAIADATGSAGHAADLGTSRTTLAEGATVVAPAGQASLTARFEADSVPEHDGATAFTVQVRITADNEAANTPPELPSLVLSESSFLITHGRITDVSRVAEGENHRWSVGVEPDSRADVALSLGPTTDCADEGAVCTGDGRMLANNTHAVIQGPPGLSVADARAAEAPDATMDFTVTLNRKLAEQVRVNYATVDGTATDGADYTSTSGTLTFAAGEITKTVSVPVLDDAHDDDGETFTLYLSNPAGGNTYLADDTATGIIENSDPMPKAWITRFGRTVTTHVIDAIQARFRDAPAETHFTLGGFRVDNLMATRGAGIDHALPGAPGGYPADGSPVGMQSGVERNAGSSHARPSLKQILMGSSFFYTNTDGKRDDYAPSGFAQDMNVPDADAVHAEAARSEVRRRWTMWGRTAETRFSGQDELLSLDGEVATAMLGGDIAWKRWLAGAVLAHSRGEGGFTHDTARGGAVTSTLTSLHPFAQYRFNERTSMWGMVGYGVGGLALTPEGADTSVDTDLRMATAAVGGRGALSVRTGEAGTFELAMRSDAMFTRTVSGDSENLSSATGAASRVRIALEGTGSMALPIGGVLTPTLEAGLRYDGGDAETGAGLEIGGGLGYSTGRLTAEVNARVLVTHEDADYREWGYSSTLRYQPGTDGRGLRLNLTLARGVTHSGVQSMWTQETAQGSAYALGSFGGQRLEAEFGYGLAGRESKSLWIPYLATRTSAGARSLRLGIRLTKADRLDAGLEFGVQDQAQGAVNYGAELRGSLRW